MHIIRLALIVAAFIGIAAGPLRAAETPQPQSDDRVLGDPKAPITIYEFASLTCPHCAAFEAETLPKLKTEWIDTGKAKLILRDYPLDQSALLAAMVARCAPPDRFYAFIGTLFQSQQSWEQSPKASLARIAKIGGMSQAEFDQCIADQKLSDSIIAARLKAQQSYGVESTPTFFINGKKVVGELPYDEFVKNLSNTGADNGTPAVGASTAASATIEPVPGTLDRARRWFDSLLSRG